MDLLDLNNMKQYIENFLLIVREKKSYLFFALPFFLILLAIIAYIVVFPQTPQQKIEPAPTATIIPTEPEPTEEVLETLEPTFDPQTEAALQELDNGEVKFAQEQDAIRKEYPWIEELPLDENDYFVYFDTDLKSFVGLLYPKTSNQLSVENQAANLKAQAQAELTDRGINYAKYPFDWRVNPEP
jgi:hypothetical protein